MSSFYKAKEVSKILDISVTQSYRIIKKLNQELEEKGYIVIAGRIPKKYFQEKYYI